VCVRVLTRLPASPASPFPPFCPPEGPLVMQKQHIIY
jgi:hypothetical protein